MRALVGAQFSVEGEVEIAGAPQPECAAPRLGAGPDRSPDRALRRRRESPPRSRVPTEGLAEEITGSGVVPGPVQQRPTGRLGGQRGDGIATRADQLVGGIPTVDEEPIQGIGGPSERSPLTECPAARSRPASVRAWVVSAIERK